MPDVWIRFFASPDLCGLSEMRNILVTAGPMVNRLSKRRSAGVVRFMEATVLRGRLLRLSSRKERSLHVIARRILKISSVISMAMLLWCFR